MSIKISIGSANPVKVAAVTELIADYPHLRDATIMGRETVSGVGDQPRTLDETITGAMNRAKAAFVDCTYSFGIESGLMVVPHTKTEHMDVCACAIYDGKEFYLGLSSAWEAPKNVMVYIEQGFDMNTAAQKAGLTTNPKVGSAEGLIGIVTKGRLNRKEYTKEAVRSALIHIDTN